jgi:ribosome-associated protein
VLKKRAKTTPKRVTRIEPKPARAAQPPRETNKEAQKMALLVAEAGLDKKAAEVEIIDVTGKVDYADYLVLMTGTSDRHVSSIAEAVDSSLAKKGYRSISVEGLPRGEWVLIDFVDVVVHVFQDRLRALYDLDGLWMDARRLNVPEASSGGS